MTIQTGSRSNPRYMDFYEEIPAPAPTEQPTPAPSPEPAPAPAPAAPAEGEPAPSDGSLPPAEPPAPAEPTPPQEPEQPRESAIQRRARELREKAEQREREASGQRSLANKLDPQDTPPAPAPQPAPPAAPSPALPEADYFDPDTGLIDPVKHAAYVDRLTDAKLAQRDAKAAGEQAQADIRAAVKNYATAVKSDADYLSTQVPELTPTSDKYNQKLDDRIEAAYKAATHDSQGNLIRIDLSMRQFAEQYVDAYREGLTAGAASIPNSQAGEGHDGALLPDAGNTSNSGTATAAEIDAMSADEYEAYLKNKGVKTVQR